MNATALGHAIRLRDLTKALAEAISTGDDAAARNLVAHAAREFAGVTDALYAERKRPVFPTPFVKRDSL